MRIAFHVPRASYLRPGFSGDKIFARALLEGLGQRGHALEVVSRLNARDVWRGKVDLAELMEEATRVRNRLERFCPDACLVYGVSNRNPDFFCWWQRAPRYVLLAADLDRLHWLPEEWRPFFPFVHRESLRRADRVAAYHPKSYGRLMEFGISPDRLSLLPPAPEPWKVQPSRAEARARLDLPTDAPVLLCVSRIPELKTDAAPGKTEMVLDLVDSASDLSPATQLLIVGDGPGRKYVEAAVARLGLESRVRLIGGVDHAEMPWYFAGSDFFAYPNPTNRPWMTVLEAQSCGIPVVVMDTPSARLTVEDGTTGLLARDPEEFGAHVAALANDRNRCAAMGAAARSYVAAQHTLAARLDRIEQLLGVTGTKPVGGVSSVRASSTSAGT